MKDNRINLLIMNDSMPVGGAESLIIQHIRHIDRRTFGVHFISLTGEGELLAEAQQEADHHACFHRRVALDPFVISQLRNYIVRRQIKIVHTNQWLDSLYAYLATLRLQVVNIASIHGYDHSWRNYAHLMIMKNYDVIVAVSHSLKLHLYKMGIPWEKLQTIYNCHDPLKFYPIDHNRDYLNNPPVRLVMVANFRWAKDPLTLIRAMHHLMNTGHKVELNLVGAWDDDLLKKCNECVRRLKLDKAIKFWGLQRVDGTFLSQFDYFVFSTFCDTFGIALLEAMACGLPVVVSDIHPCLELIEYGKCGLYFETGNPVSCAGAIRRLMEDPGLAQALGERAALRSQDFKPEKIVSELEALYLRMIDGLGCRASDSTPE